MVIFEVGLLAILSTMLVYVGFHILTNLKTVISEVRRLGHFELDTLMITLLQIVVATMLIYGMSRAPLLFDFLSSRWVV